MSQPRRVVVLGAGAIGAPVGALLAEQGVDVVLVARGAHGQALRDGLDLRLPDGPRRLHTPVVASLEAAAVTPDDLVLCTVMGHHTEAAVAALDRTVPVASLQNGSRPPRILRELGFPTLHVVVGVPAERRAPGVVALSGDPGPGWFLADAAGPYADWLVRELGKAGFQAETVDDVAAWSRAKELGNLAGVLIALCDAFPRDVLKAAVREAKEVWEAAGLRYHTRAELAERTGNLRTTEVDGLRRVGGSTRHALRRGDALETASLHGPIVALGRQVGVPTPVNAGLIDLAERAVREGWAPGSRSADVVREAVGLPRES